jgi:hypothetical protein
MDTVWERVRQLQGQTLWTKTGKAFQVVFVDDRYVTVKPEQTGNQRPIRRIEVEAAYDLHIPMGELTATRLVKERVTVVNPVYIVSILKCIEGVSDPQPKSKSAFATTRAEQDSAEAFISQLERIVNLHKQGILSDQDFARAKLKLLKITE